MTDQKSDQQDGDGMRNRILNLIPDIDVISLDRAFGLLREIKAICLVPPTRDGAEGAGESYCSLNIGPQPGEIGFKGYNNETWSAPPNPAADAMRLLERIRDFPYYERSSAQQAVSQLARGAIAILSAPVLPADGAPKALVLQFTPEELHVVQELSEYHQLSELQTMRRALRLYQLRLAPSPAVAADRREALAQAFALHRWNAKLENLPDDMKDGCYAFAGSVQSGEQ